MADPVVLTIHTDGASRGNPGEAAYAYVIEGNSQDDPIEEAAYLGRITNNQAEYTALVKALEHALELGPDHEVVVHSDSELMVKQMRGEYRVKNEDLRPLYEAARDLARQFSRVTYRHVRREQNKRADELCNLILDGKLPSSIRTLVPPKKAQPSLFPPETATPTPPAASKPSLHQQAAEVLREAASAWGVKKPTPTPEEVWAQVVKVLQQHGVKVPAS